MYVLVDCNNFFVSCERLFAPRLAQKPVIVLSNCDGCVISRSQEAKNLGIPMGAPFFQVKSLCKKAAVTVFSANFALYEDISRRIMRILTESAPEIEVYSIDEAFLQFPSTEQDLYPNDLKNREFSDAECPRFESEKTDSLLDIGAVFSGSKTGRSAQEKTDSPGRLGIYTYCLELKKKIHTWTGIPVSIGIAPTKTLAKIATHIAKNEISGVFDLREKQTQDAILTTFSISDIWGIGKKSAATLSSQAGITTALEFRDLESSRVRSLLGVLGEKTHLELQGNVCFSFGEMVRKKSILVSRSFSGFVIDTHTLLLALSSHVQDACEKLRKQESFARAGEVFIEILQENAPRKHISTSFYIPIPANDTPTILSIAKESLTSLLNTTMKIKKCGILLFDFIQEEDLSSDLFWKDIDPKKKKCMALVDAMNARFGRNTLFYASTKMTNNPLRSSRYTTCWDELAIVT